MKKRKISKQLPHDPRRIHPYEGSLPSNGEVTLVKISLSPCAARMNSAENILSQKRNSDTPGEAWLISGGKDTKIGQLNGSQNSWLDKSVLSGEYNAHDRPAYRGQG